MSMNSVNDRLSEATKDDEYLLPIIGIVQENADPLGIARIKVKITNVLDADQGPVPWCLPTKKSPFGQGAGYGVYGSPAVGSPVRITFQGGDPHYPVYEADEYLAAHANPKFKDPKTWGYKDPGGSELFVNYETGAWEWTHQSGTSFKYDGDGNMSMHVAKDQTNDVVGNVTTTVGGNVTETVNGSLNETVQGNATLTYQSALNFTVVGDAQIGIQGSLTANVGGNTNLTSGGPLNVSAPTINLN